MTLSTASDLHSAFRSTDIIFNDFATKNISTFFLLGLSRVKCVEMIKVLPRRQNTNKKLKKISCKKPLYLFKLSVTKKKI